MRWCKAVRLPVTSRFLKLLLAAMLESGAGGIIQNMLDYSPQEGVARALSVVISIFNFCNFFPSFECVRGAALNSKAIINT